MDFKQKLISCQISMCDLDDYIDIWHKSDTTLTLQQFLGFSDKEYHCFIHTPEKLESLLRGKHEFISQNKKG